MVAQSIYQVLFAWIGLRWQVPLSAFVAQLRQLLFMGRDANQSCAGRVYEAESDKGTQPKYAIRNLASLLAAVGQQRSSAASSTNMRRRAVAPSSGIAELDPTIPAPREYSASLSAVQGGVGEQHAEGGAGSMKAT